jgi:hypothetical protein
MAQSGCRTKNSIRTEFHPLGRSEFSPEYRHLRSVKKANRGRTIA